MMLSRFGNGDFLSGSQNRIRSTIKTIRSTIKTNRYNLLIWCEANERYTSRSFWIRTRKPHLSFDNYIDIT